MEFVIVILLTVIAIGVLLITETGRQILESIVGLVAIGIVLCLLFGIVFLGYVFFTSPTGQTFRGGIETVFEGIAIIVGIIAFVTVTTLFFQKLWKELREVFSWKRRKEIRLRLHQHMVKNSGLFGMMLALSFFMLILSGAIPSFIGGIIQLCLLAFCILLIILAIVSRNYKGKVVDNVQQAVK